ncbi:hypothetical protein GPECTOR_69g450 [Gonium pectorale]|uniref:S-acyltransferase n=1 Tax=Gonium pectorale TaxID=33097 RepID=A0A150G3C7_GONPE|nr:hypothetical protein GPECTOR_69g450 [Gonium pectorale]|eukprot:KXZ44357.1 hypothetical protein GPECTOR_69g450 [Gonium pectorale]
MVLGGFYIYWTNLFSLLPNAWVDEGHILTGSASVLLSLALFVAACASDPGTVRREQLPAWHALYPLDGAIFPPKECETCVGRHDHHCQWINNCVGYNNIRLFLAFLLANTAMCAYGALLAGLILGGEMQARGLFEVKLVNYRTGQVVPLTRLPGKMAEWLIIFYPLGVAMALFMGVATLLTTAFLSYQIYLIAIGRTQYEVWKWRDLHSELLRRAEAEELVKLVEGGAAEPEAEGAKLEAAKGRGEGDRRAGPGSVDGEGRAGGPAASSGGGAAVKGTWWSRTFGGGGGDGGGAAAAKPKRRRVSVELPRNIYHKGFWANASEVFLPELHFQRATRRAAAAAGGAAPAVGVATGSGGGGGAAGRQAAGGQDAGAGRKGSGARSKKVR